MNTSPSIPVRFATAGLTIYLISEAIKLGGPTREDVKSALPQLKDVPSVIYGTIVAHHPLDVILPPQTSQLDAG